MDANANAAGDTCNRGSLVGGLLGLAFGASNLPPALLTGLVRHAELAATFGALADRVVAHLATAPRARTTARIGHPWPLARLAYGPATPIAAPRDDPAKLAAMGRDAARSGAPLRAIRYVRGVGAVVALPGALLATVVGPTAAAAAALSGGGGVVVLEEGDAAADRAAALAALTRGGAGANGVVPSAGAAAAAVPATAAVAAAAAASSYPMRKLDAAMLVADGTLACVLAGASRDAAALDVPPGTGVFYYLHPTDLAARRRR